MRTLVLGAGGQLGRDLARAFRSSGEVRGYTRSEVDITDEAALYRVVEAFPPDVILNAAAYTNVEAAEDDFEGAFMTNEAGARHVAELAEYRSIPVVYFSTDYVFGNAKVAPYQVNDPIAPLGVYGKSKAAGEAAVRKACMRHFIVRTAWLYGPGGNNFVEKILGAAQTRPTLRVVEDEVGCPTYTKDLAEAVYYLTRSKHYGTYHIVNGGSCSRYEQAKAIVELAGLKTVIEPCPATEFPAKAERPHYSVLATDAYERATGHELRPWKDALTDYMQQREAVK
jgi:dTDP-4-dehydrorhamnose reductase